VRATAQAARARVGVDVGGTFTDLVAAVNGTLLIARVPSTPDDRSPGGRTVGGDS
jgi:N-methylhydantoinase A